MNIYEATKKATKESKTIYRRSTKQDSPDWYFEIRPTNSYEGCQLIAVSKTSRKSARLWMPTLDDLVAEDWEVTI